jgi:hypothetical protein
MNCRGVAAWGVSECWSSGYSQLPALFSQGKLPTLFPSGFGVRVILDHQKSVFICAICGLTPFPNLLLNLRLLLGQAVESAEAPNQFRAINRNNPPVSKAILENFGGLLILG